VGVKATNLGVVPEQEHDPLEQALLFAELHPLDCPDHHRASDDGMPPHPEDKP
jgi:hypothetical protein